MKRFLAFAFITSCLVAIGSAISSSELSEKSNRSASCGKYLSFEECMEDASAMVTSCRKFYSPYFEAKQAKSCDTLEEKLYKQCDAYSARASCLDCFAKVDKAVERCQQHVGEVNCDQDSTANECKEMETAMQNFCTIKKCQVCKDVFCRNGGKCAGPRSARCSCPPGYGGAFCQKSLCADTPCKNGGSCIGKDVCRCPASFSGDQCTIRNRLGTKENPAPNAQAILDAGDSSGNGLYWIQPPGESAPAQTFCDMDFAGGAWMLASYGYVHTLGTSSDNHAIPNMNNPFGYNWRPSHRAFSNGLINLPEGAVKMARNARYMIMAAGKNPISGGIDTYSYVYRIYLKYNPYEITFKNHNRFNGGQHGRMNVTDFVVEGLKGDSGTYHRYALGEALGVTWTDSFPTGYGFNDKNSPSATFSNGPFFPSVLSGSGRSPCSGCTPTNYEPDVVGGSPHYTHHGWYTANGWDYDGQTSIWFK